MPLILLGHKPRSQATFREVAESSLKIVKFDTLRIEDGAIITGGKIRRRVVPRKEREMAAGNGWTKEQWQAHLESFGNRCLKCGCTDSLIADHVIPLYRGGKHDLSNIQPLCSDCNLAKGLTIVDYRVTQAQTLVNA